MAVPLMALVIWVVVADRSAIRAWPVAALLLIGLIVLAVPTEAWQKFLSRIEHAGIGPFNVGLRDLEKAAEKAPPSDTEEVGDTEEETKKAETVFDLRMQLEWKLAYIAKHLLRTDEGVTFVTIGSLKFDDYLDESEARTAASIMMASEDELARLPGAERRKFIEDAQTFLDGLRTAVFWGRVKRELQGREDENGREDEDADDLTPTGVEGTGGRHDLLVGDTDEEARIIPILAINPGSRKIKRAIEPIEQGDLPSPTTKRQIIVTPDTSTSKAPSSLPSGVEVVKLCDLRRTLKRGEER